MKKKLSSFWICNIAGLLIGYFAIFRQLRSAGADVFAGTDLPAGFPSSAGLMVIWAFLFVLWGIGSYFVYSVPLRPRRERNIFLNSLILVIGIFIWNFLVFSSLNFPGSLAVAIAILLLAVVVWFMYLVIHRYGGYLFIPMMIWMVFLLYLSIALVVKN